VGDVWRAGQMLLAISKEEGKEEEEVEGEGCRRRRRRRRWRMGAFKKRRLECVGDVWRARKTVLEYATS